MSFDIGSIPIVGDIYNAARGNPDAIKAAYDQAIKASQTGGQDIKNFLLGQQAKSQQFYAPIQAMFNRAYGTQGIAGPQIPQAPGASISTMYGGR